MAGLKELTGLGGLQITGLLGVAALTLCLWRRYFSPISDIPGPFTASFTRLWHILRILKGDQNLELIRLHDTHGHFVRVAHNEVSVSHPEAIRKILGAPLHKGSWYKVIAFPDGRFENPMSATDPKVKMDLSKHLAPAYTLSNLLHNEDSISKTIELLLGWLDKFSASGSLINLDQYFTFTTSDVVGEAVFSTQFGFSRAGRDINNTIANAHPQAAYVSVAGFFRWFHILFLSNPVITWLNITPWGHLIDTAMTAIKERQKNPDARMDAVAHWFRMLQQHPDRMQLHEIHSAAFNAVAAGNETVSTALQAFVYFMIRHPNAWKRARAEIDAAGINDRVVRYTDAQNLPFLQACIKEALRIFGPASMGLPRIAPEGGITFGDRTIPQGTIVSVNIWVMHYSKETWGPDAREFNPDRWLGEDALHLAKYFIPWGMGYASCPGQNLARIELNKICATLVRDYDIRQANPEQEWTWKAFFTVVPHNWPCYIQKRNKKG
ncbi:benzoate 4-monooxygenase cytochrome P450 [Paracoccidioides lutzii Pb01]|uniref:Benzoate 4-monooxygenase cytochrome P450 n=1 Tax=Paracoccidioides lutzii (strain ATCC MYA-826 / Pb01) TaxID=502779 RepID=C1GS73_PARBA|nr:benzoate 4-monooxygenase cytochrome P450 [Paracoccidioides lutzii Pb01]EEH38906.2 benzoate 4-monooxygenase cytochrome P450 [Paracoccidioides lutzii Pb01]